MLGLFKKMFGIKPAQTVEVPYKVEAPVVQVLPTLPEATAETTAKNKAAAVSKAKRSPAKKAPVKKAAAMKAPRKPKTS